MHVAHPALAVDQFSAGERRPKVHLFLVTADQLCKITGVLTELAELPPDVQLTVLCGCAEDSAAVGIPGARVLRFAGETTFDLRRRISELAGDVDWLLLLEDHNQIDRSWLERVRQAVAAVPSEVQTIRGGADNRTSTDRWSWANFLMVLGFHWTPRQSDAPEPLFFNVAFRRSLLPAQRMDGGEFEVHVLATLTENSVAADFAIDHVQFRRFPGVFFYHLVQRPVDRRCHAPSSPRWRQACAATCLPGRVGSHPRARQVDSAASKGGPPADRHACPGGHPVGVPRGWCCVWRPVRTRQRRPASRVIPSIRLHAVSMLGYL